MILTVGMLQNPLFSLKKLVDEQVNRRND